MRGAALKLAAFAAFALIGTVASQAGAALVLAESPEKASLNNPLFEALGSMKEAVGDTIYLRADEYFHAGMDRNILSRHSRANENPDDPNYHVKIGTVDWAMRVNRQIKVIEHKHLDNRDAKEILPLLHAATTLNPKNIDANLTAAYWLEKATGDSAKSLEVLQRVMPEHPEDWKVPFAIGEILDKKQKDPAKAVPYYAAAVQKLAKDNAMPFDWIRVRYALAEALAATGDTAGALTSYKEALFMADQRPKSALQGILRQKIKKLEAAAPTVGTVSESVSSAAALPTLSR